ncbi:MAG: TraR/DksA family transcriptional regulator [Piscinibacter sp.]|nr:TraR/DksA family transcriptional regulator [Piscinibacter sp.]
MPSRYPLDPASPDAAAVRATLQARRDALGREIGAVRDAAETRGADVLDHKDEASLRERTEVGDAEVARDVAELREVETALRRLEEGRYGLCMDCDEPVDPRRLAAEPFAVRCAACQTRAEQARALRR